MGEVLLVSPLCLRAEGCQEPQDWVQVMTSGLLWAAQLCLYSWGDVLRASFSGVTSHQTQDVSKPLVRCMGGRHILLQSCHFQA